GQPRHGLPVRLAARHVAVHERRGAERHAGVLALRAALGELRPGVRPHAVPAAARQLRARHRAAHARPDPVLHPGGLRLRPHAVPRARPAARPRALDPHGAVAGLPAVAVPDHPEPRPARQRRRPRAARPVQRLRHLPHADGVSRHAERARGGRAPRRRQPLPDLLEDHAAARPAHRLRAGDHHGALVVERAALAPRRHHLQRAHAAVRRSRHPHRRPHHRLPGGHGREPARHGPRARHVRAAATPGHRRPGLQRPQVRPGAPPGAPAGITRRTRTMHRRTRVLAALAAATLLGSTALPTAYAQGHGRHRPAPHPHATTATYAPSDENVPNPQRGFYHRSETHYRADGSGYTPLDQATLEGYRTGGITQILRVFYLEKFASTPQLDQAFLDLVQADYDT